MNKSKLFIPMYMEALALSTDKNNCCEVKPQLQNYRQSVLGSAISANTSTNSKLEKGIHLHWSLPKALKHSFLEKDKEMKFPFAPNRWMVVRLRTDLGTEAVPSRSWIIRSDHDNTTKNNKPQPNWVIMHDDKLTFKNLGKVSEWSNDYIEGKTEPILTAVGAADPYFASSYSSCRNVFGFHDDMKDISEDCTVTYVVCGWYSDPAMDPLTPIDHNSNLGTEGKKMRNRELDWFKEQWLCDEKEYPESGLFHTSVTNIHWTNDLRSGVPDGSIAVYAGNTAIEALSAQIIASNEIEKPGVEDYLNALQYQLLEDTEYEPGFEEMIAEIHKRGFSPKSSNITWEITRNEANNNIDEKEEDKPNFPNNQSLLTEFKSLNKVQARFNRKNNEIASLQQEYYFLWYKQASKTVNNYDAAGFDYLASRKTILDKIVDAKVDSGLYSKQIEKHLSNLDMYKELSGNNADYSLKEKPDERYWEPNDPVLLFSGPGVGAVNKPDFKTDEKAITCRVESQLLNKLKLDVPYNDTIISVVISAYDIKIPGIEGMANSNLPVKELQQLINETFLLDASFSVDFALKAYTKAQIGQDKDKTSSVVKAYADTIRQTQHNPKYSDGSKPHEKFSIRSWEQAWTPLFMVWDATYKPDINSFKNLDIIKKTDKTKAGDRLFKQSLVNGDTEDVAIKSVSPFSSSVFANLKKVLPDAIVNKYGNLNLIAQSLSGLHRMLVMQRPDIQFPPFDYTPDDDFNFESSYRIDRTELSMIGDEGYRLGVNPGRIDGGEKNIFNPLRSGHIKINNLSIVDAFGQVKKVITNEDTIYSSIRCAVTLNGGEKGRDSMIPLPPRIVQPSRLQFNWLTSNNDIIYQDSGKMENAVIGWLVPNYLDNNILVYDGNGNEVLILQIASDITKDKGLKLIKSPFPGKNEVVNDPVNTPLNNILDKINSGTVVTGLMDLAYKINLNVTKGNGLQNNTAALLCGQPIAIAQCAVRLEVLGLPYNNQRWDKSGMQDTGNIETVRFPLSLGSYNLEKDGLLGYFIDNAEDDGLYITQNAPEFKFSESEPFFRKEQTVTIKVKDTPTEFIVLLDPSAGFHLTTGILPIKFVQLFGHSTSRLLSELDIGFMAAPFIADKTNPGIPIPSGINGSWKWTHKSDVVTWQNEDVSQEGKNKQVPGFKKQQIYEGWLRMSNLKSNN